MYISLAAYRDHMLQSTIDSAFENAAEPEKLEVGCFISIIDSDPDLQKQLISNDYFGQVKWETEPAGTVFSVTRARNKSIQWLTDKHDYVLQVDSHSRFLPGWDTELRKAYEELLVENAVFSGYIPSWFPNEDGTETYREFNNDWLGYGDYNNEGSKHAFFDTYEIVPRLPSMPNPNKTSLKTWHTAGMFLFGPAEYFLELPQPEWIVFWGEELYNSLRTFTHGWDVYSPNVMPIRQMYPQDISSATSQKLFGTPDGPHKNWKDFGEEWFQQERASTDRIIDAILDRTTGPEHLGTERSLDDLYELIGYDIGALYDGWRREYKALR